MKLYSKTIFAIALLGIGCAANAENQTPPPDPIQVPVLSKDSKSDKGRKPRMPAAHPLPVCVYADGILSVSFPRSEGEAEVVITHADYTEEYTMSTEYEIIISTDLLDGDTVEISTEAGYTYVAVYEE